MGSGNSSNKLYEYEEDLSILDINRIEVNTFYKIFTKMIYNMKNKNYITVHDILKFIDIPQSNFALRALCTGFCETTSAKTQAEELKIFESYQFDFKTFVYSMWNFLTLCPKTLVSFIFCIYDADVSGHIDPQEAQTIIRDIHGDNFGTNLEVLRDYNKLSMLVRKHLDLEGFKKFAAGNKKIFKPAYDIQAKLASKVMGPSFWFAHTKRRKVLFLYKYQHVFSVMEKIRVTREKDEESNSNWESASSHTALSAVDSMRSSSFNEKSGIKKTAPVTIDESVESFYEQPGEVTSNSITPYSMLQKSRSGKVEPVAISEAQAIQDSNILIKPPKKEEIIVKTDAEKKEEILKNVRNVQSFSRSRDFLKTTEKKEKSVKKFTKAQIRKMKRENSNPSRISVME